MERLISVAAIDYEAKYCGQLLFVDTDGRLKVWGRQSQRGRLNAAIKGREDEMKRFLTARALREEG